MLKIFVYILPLWKRLVVISIGFGFMAFLQLQIPRNVGLITNLVLSASPTQEILQTGLIMLGFSVGVIGLAIFNALMNSYIATGFARNVREAVFKKVNTLSLSEFEKFGTSSLMTRTTNDVQQIQGILLFGLRIIITTPCHTYYRDFFNVKRQCVTRLCVCRFCSNYFHYYWNHL